MSLFELIAAGLLALVFVAVAITVIVQIIDDWSE